VSSTRCSRQDVNGTQFDHPREEHKCTLPAGHRDRLHVCRCGHAWE